MPAIKVPCVQMVFYKAESAKMDQATLGSNLPAYVTSTFVTTLLYPWQFCTLAVGKLDAMKM